MDDGGVVARNLLLAAARVNAENETEPGLVAASWTVPSRAGFQPIFAASEIAQVEPVAAVMPRRAHRGVDAAKPVREIELLRRVHAGQRLEIAAPEAERARHRDSA